jgi:putative transposase
MLVDKENALISLTRQLELLDINKSSYYYQRVPMPEETLELLQLVDKVYTDYPIFGTRKMCDYLRNEYNKEVTRHKMRTVYDHLQIRAIYQEPKHTVTSSAHKKYPYLLKDVVVSHVNYVWSTDITNIYSTNLKAGLDYGE